MQHQPQPRRSREKGSNGIARLERMQPDAAGIDCGQNSHCVAVPPERDPQSVRELRTFSTDLPRLADWLAQCRIKTVAMESTGVYWIAVYELLEQRGFELLLVNARDVHHVRGRQSEVTDCAWRRELQRVGLWRASCRPAAAIVPLRSFVRQRASLVEQAATRLQRRQQALTEMKLKLHTVLSDRTGRTGLALIRSIL
jgi:transposase